MKEIFFIFLTKQFTLSRESGKIPRCANSGTLGAWELKLFTLSLYKKYTENICFIFSRHLYLINIRIRNRCDLYNYFIDINIFVSNLIYFQKTLHVFFIAGLWEVIFFLFFLFILIPKNYFTIRFLIISSWV